MQLYDKYGGFVALSPIVHAFYDKVLASPSLDRYFADVEMPALIEHQIKFLVKVFGGPDNQTEGAMREAHAPHEITPEAFAEVAGLLKEALEEARIEAADIATILGVLASMRPDIVVDAAPLSSHG
jgi:hemoglobin